MHAHLIDAIHKTHSVYLLQSLGFRATQDEGALVIAVLIVLAIVVSLSAAARAGRKGRG